MYNSIRVKTRYSVGQLEPRAHWQSLTLFCSNKPQHHYPHYMLSCLNHATNRQFSSMHSTSFVTCFCYWINVHQKSCTRFLHPFWSTINPAIFARTNNEMRTTFSALVKLLDLTIFILFFYYGKGSLAANLRVGLQAVKYCILIFIY